MSEIFAKRLREARERKALTQETLGKKLGLTNGSISGYERNYREPDLDTLFGIAKLLDVSVSYLLGETDVYLAFLGDEERKADKWMEFLNQLRGLSGTLTAEQIEAFVNLGKAFGVKGINEEESYVVVK